VVVFPSFHPPGGQYDGFPFSFSGGVYLTLTKESACLQDLCGDIELSDHRTLILWALDCVTGTLSRIDQLLPGELRAHKCIELCDLWSRGDVKMPVAKKAILGCHAIAKTINDREAIALCHAAGHAGATVHVKTHALGLPIYELTGTVIGLGSQNWENTIIEKIQYYQRRLAYWRVESPRVERAWAAFL
jgi:hypothetical protein